MAYSDQFPHLTPATARPGSTSDILLSPHLLWKLMQGRARRIAATAALAFVLLAAVIIVLPPQYSGTAIVLVDPRQPRVMQSDAVLNGIGNDMAAVDSQIEVIQSSGIAKKVIADLRLEDDPEFVPSTGLTGLLRSLLGRQPEDRMQYALQRFATELKVRRRGATYILEIEFRSRSAERSAQVANAVANAYLEQQSALKASATSDASNWLAERLTQLRKQATDADAAVARYREENGLVNSGDRRSVVEQQLADVNQQLVAARVRTEEVRSRLKQIDKASSDPARQSLVEAQSSPVIIALRAQYAQALKTGAELAQTLGPKHPAIKTSEAEQASIGRQIDVEIKRIVAGVKNEFETAQSREKALDADLTRLKSTMASNDQARVRLHELEREAEAAQAILQRSLARYKETREQEGVQVADARILSPAVVPITTNGPNRKLLLAAALAASLIFAIMLTAAREGRGTELPIPTSPTPGPNSGSRTTGERRELPVLGYLPDVGSKSGTGASLRAGETAGVAGEGGLHQFLLNASLSPFREAVGRLASDFVAAAPKRAFVHVMTGAASELGTSTVTATFADALASLSNSRVLRVDAAPMAANGRQGPRRVGLAQTVKAALPVEFAIDKTGEAKADVLYLGIDDEAGFLELADSRVLADTLIALQSTYEIIVIDAGLPVTSAQSGRLVALSDSAILIATDVTSLQQPAVIDAVEGGDGKFIGVVMNRSALDVYREARIRAVQRSADAAPPASPSRMAG